MPSPVDAPTRKTSSPGAEALVVVVELTVIIPVLRLTLPTIGTACEKVPLGGSADRTAAGIVRVPADAGATQTNSPPPRMLKLASMPNALIPLT